MFKTQTKKQWELFFDEAVCSETTANKGSWFGPWGLWFDCISFLRNWVHLHVV